MFETTAQMMLGDHLYGHTFIPPRAWLRHPAAAQPAAAAVRHQDGLVALVCPPAATVGKTSCVRSGERAEV
jgi:hypothetical protein